jgi:hypothetical protein
MQIGSRCGKQARCADELSLAAGRTPYFHFEGPPSDEMVKTVERCSRRYGVEMVVRCESPSGPLDSC